MFSIVEIVLLFMKIADKIMGEIHDSKAFKAGTDAEIAKTAASILGKTQAMKHVREQVNALTADAVDKQLADLEPKS